MAHDIGPASRWIGMSVTGDLGPLTLYTSQRGTMVVFPRAPPLHPATPLQEVFRVRFQQAAADWRQLTQAQRDEWLDAAHRAGLRIGGYCLWTWYWLERDASILATVERQSGITLAKPP